MVITEQVKLIEQRYNTTQRKVEWLGISSH